MSYVDGICARVAISTVPDPSGSGRVDMLTSPVAAARAAAATGAWVQSKHGMYLIPTWKCGSLNFIFTHPPEDVQHVISTLYPYQSRRTRRSPYYTSPQLNYLHGQTKTKHRYTHRTDQVHQYIIYSRSYMCRHEMWYDSRIIQISPDKHVLQSQPCLACLIRRTLSRSCLLYTSDAADE